MLMKKLLIAFLSLASMSSFAAAYGTAGCGLGSILIGNDEGFVQVFAATTNGTSGSQVFGISSGTSNCGKTAKTTAQFIEVNKSTLMKDAARGNGETLSALSEIYGCSNTKKFNTVLKGNYKKIFKTNEAKNIDSQIKKVIKERSLSCSAKLI